MGGFPGYDAVIQAMVGMFSINGMPESGPTRIGIPLVDLGTGLYAAIAVLMALLERARSGQGQFIDMTLYDAGIALMHPHIPNYVMSGQLPALTGNAHPNICPYDRFPTATVPVFLAIGNDRAFRRLCAELGAPGAGERPALRQQRRPARPPHRADGQPRGAARRAGRRGALPAPARGRHPGRAGARHRPGLGRTPTPATARWRPSSRATGLGPADQALAHPGRDRPHPAALRRARPRDPGRVRLFPSRDRRPGRRRRPGRAAPALAVVAMDVVHARQSIVRQSIVRQSCGSPWCGSPWCGSPWCGIAFWRSRLAGSGRGRSRPAKLPASPVAALTGHDRPAHSPARGNAVEPVSP